MAEDPRLEASRPAVEVIRSVAGSTRMEALSGAKPMSTSIRLAHEESWARLQSK